MSTNINISVTKASGEREQFDIKKLIGSLEKAGADTETINYITSDIKTWMHDGISTKKIYARAFSLLKSKTHPAASRYKLKKAIMEMGPTGYPFEHLVSRIMELDGYKTQTGIVVQGFCVSHEVDVIATKNNEQILTECKYGQHACKIVSVKVPLYIHSRVNDIVKKREKMPEYKGFTFKGCIATNTRFTSDAIDYAKCNNMLLLAWDYPQGKGIKDIIDREKIYPITVLNNITKAQKQKLMDDGIVICRQLQNNQKVLDQFGLTSRKTKAILNEIENIII